MISAIYARTSTEPRAADAPRSLVRPAVPLPTRVVAMW